MRKRLTWAPASTPPLTFTPASNLHRTSPCSSHLTFLFLPLSSVVSLYSPLISCSPPPLLPPSNGNAYLLAHCLWLGRHFEPQDERADPVMRILIPRKCLALTRTHAHGHTLASFEQVNFTVLLGYMSNASYFKILLPRGSGVKVLCRQSITLACGGWTACICSEHRTTGKQVAWFLGVLVRM